MLKCPAQPSLLPPTSRRRRHSQPPLPIHQHHTLHSAEIFSSRTNEEYVGVRNGVLVGIRERLASRVCTGIIGGFNLAYVVLLSLFITMRDSTPLKSGRRRMPTSSSHRVTTIAAMTTLLLASISTTMAFSPFSHGPLNVPHATISMRSQQQQASMNGMTKERRPSSLLVLANSMTPIVSRQS